MKTYKHIANVPNVIAELEAMKLKCVEESEINSDSPDPVLYNESLTYDTFAHTIDKAIRFLNMMP